MLKINRYLLESEKYFCTRGYARVFFNGEESQPKKKLPFGFIFSAVILLVVFVYLFQFTQNTFAAATSTINFQARLEGSDGAIVPDGCYNVEFKLYSASSGGTNYWTEDYLNTNSGTCSGSEGGVEVSNGYLTVNLGSVNPFSNASPAIPWSQQLYLGINIGGTTDSGSPTWDGEMSPRLLLTAVPYAFQSEYATSLQTTSGSDTSTLSFATPTANNTITIPDDSGGDTVCLVTLANCSGTSGGSGDTHYIENQTSLQSSANFDIQSSSIGSTTGIIEALSGQTAGLLDFVNSNYNSSPVAANILSGFNNNGQLYYTGTTGDTGTITAPTLSGNVTYTLPSTSGTICLDSSTSCGFAASSGSGSYINNSSSPAQTANFNITGTGQAGTSFLSPLFDVASGTLQLGTSTASAISIGQSGITTTNNGPLTVTGLLTANGGLTSTAATNIDTTGSSALNIGTGSYSGDVYIGNNGAITTLAGNSSSNITFTNFSVSGAGAVVGVGVNSGSGLLQGTGGLTLTGAANINTSGSSATNVGTGSYSGSVTVGNSSASSVKLQASSNNSLLINSTGTAVAGIFGVAGYTTTNTSNTYNGEWTELGTCTITSQFQDCNTELHIIGGGSGSVASIEAVLSWRVKQQAALGSAPLIQIVMNNEEYITSSNIMAVTTENDGTATVVQLWGQDNQSYDDWHFTPYLENNGGGTLAWLNNSGFSASLPAGTQTSTQYDDINGNSLSVVGSSTLTGAANINISGSSATNVGTGSYSGTLALGNSSSTTAVKGNSSSSIAFTNFNVASNGLVTLLGGLAPDITTATASTANTIGLQPGVSSSSTGSTSGATLTLQGGNDSGAPASGTVTGGTLSLLGGNATGASGTRDGGNVTIDAGTGATANGNLNIGTSNSATTTLGRTGGTTTINGNSSSSINFNSGGFSVSSSGGNYNLVASGAIQGNSFTNNASTSSATFQVNTSGNETLGSGSSDGLLTFVDGSSSDNGVGLTLQSSTTTAFTLYLPTDSTSSQSANVCVYSATYSINNCGFATSSADGSYIENQNSSPQSANFDISGTGEASTLLANTVNVVSGSTLSVGTIASSTLYLGNSGATTINEGNTSSVVSLVGSSSSSIEFTNFNVSAAGAVRLGTSGTGVTLQEAASPSTPATVTIPDVTGNVCLIGTSTAGTNTGCFVQGGNAFGATAILGTTDSNPLELEGNSNIGLTVTTAGTVGINTTSSASGVPLSVKSTLSDATVDAVTGNCSGTNWSGSAGTYTVTSGTTALTCTLTSSTVSGKTYEVVYSVSTSSGTPSITAAVAGVSGTASSGSQTYYSTLITAGSASTSFTFTPASITASTTVMIIGNEIYVPSSPTIELLNSGSGTDTLEVRNSSSNTNVLIGLNAGALNSGSAGGTSNVALGYNASEFNYSNSAITAVGAQALQDNSGAGATGLGYQAGLANQGTDTVAVGYQSGEYNQGNYSVSIGYQTLQGTSTTPATGADNVAIGYSSGQNITSANNVVAIGLKAGLSITSGSGDTFLGADAGYLDYGGGNYATFSDITNSTAIGINANVQENNAIVLGSVNNATLTGIGTTVPINTFSVSPPVATSGYIGYQIYDCPQTLYPFLFGTNCYEGASHNGASVPATNELIITGGGSFSGTTIGDEVVWSTEEGTGVNACTTSYETVNSYDTTTDVEVSGSPCDVASSGTPISFRLHYMGLQVENNGQVVIGNLLDGEAFSALSGEALAVGCRATTSDVCAAGVAGYSIYANGTISGGNGSLDYAENIPTEDSDSINAGDLVSMDPSNNDNGVLSSGAYDPNLLGVISTHPGYITNGGIDPETGQVYSYLKPLALNGRVPVNVTGENGPIKPGDYITSSDTPGYGMRATEPGKVIGMAMTAFNGTSASDVGQVTLEVENFYYNPESATNMQGGNQYTSTSLVGTSDDQNLSIETDGVTRAIFDTSGNLLFTGPSTVSTESGDLSLKSADNLNLDTENGGSINIGTGSTTDAITIGNSSATAVDINAAYSTSSTEGVIIGAQDGNQTNLVLDGSSTFLDAGTCSTSVNDGALYYNTNAASVSLRTCIDGSWRDVITNDDLGIMLYGVVPDSGSYPGDLASNVTNFTTGPCKVSWLSNTSVSVSGCTLYTGGRKVVQAATTITGLSGVSDWYHLCYTGSNDTLAASAGGAETANMPAWSATTPVLCLADVETGGSSTITNIYDTRVFTTDTKTFGVTDTAVGLGWLLKQSGTSGQVAPTNASGNDGPLVGVVGLYSGTVSTTTPNVIYVTNGPTFIKTNGTSTVALPVTSSGTSGYSTTTSGGSSTIYGNLGVSQLTVSSSCSAANDCQYSQLVNIDIR